MEVTTSVQVAPLYDMYVEHYVGEEKVTQDKSSIEKATSSLFAKAKAFFTPSPTKDIQFLLSDQSSLRLPKNAKAQKYFVDLLEKLMSKPLGRDLVMDVARGDRLIELNYSKGAHAHTHFSKANKSKNILSISPEKAVYTLSVMENGELHVEKTPKHIAFAHELIHAYHYQRNIHLHDYPPTNALYTSLEEENTIVGVPGFDTYTENKIRKEFGEHPRMWHMGFESELIPGQDHKKLQNASNVMYDACMLGNLTIIEELLEHGFTFEAKGNHESPLHTFLDFHPEQFDEILDLIERKGIVIAAEDIVPYACDLGELQVVSTLLKRGYSPNCQGRTGETPLTYAALHQDKELLQLLLQHHVDLNLRNGDKRTALQVALRFQSTQIALELLRLGIELDLELDVFGRSVFHDALFSSEETRVALLNKLVELMDTFPRKQLESWVSFVIANGWEFVIHEMASGAEVIKEICSNTPLYNNKKLLDYYAFIEKCDLSPLSYAILQGDKEFARALIQAGASVLYHDRLDDWNHTPMYLAIDREQYAILRNMITPTTIREFEKTYGLSILHAFILEEMPILEFRRYIQKYPQLKNTLDEYGNTPLHLAIEKNLPPSITSLLITRENLEKSNNLGYTPLHVAALHDNVTLANVLHEKGANLFVECPHGGFTPSDIAEVSGSRKFIDWIEKHKTWA
jgi:ankyrin repeat protein